MSKLISYEFNLLLSFMVQVTRTTHCLATHLQQKSLDILSTIEMVTNTIRLIRNMRNDDEALQCLMEVRTDFSPSHPYSTDILLGELRPS
jgi:hypothetical protein